jgi:hypothetical protein
MEFDSFYINIGGLSDDGYHNATVTIGFWDNDSKCRSDVAVHVRMKAGLDVPLRGLREQAKVLALVKLQEALQLLEQFSADQLHSKAQDALVESKARADDDLQQALSEKFGDTT